MATNPTEWYRDSRQYLTEVGGEYRKITWPPQKEAVAGTIGVVVISSIPVFYTPEKSFKIDAVN